MRRNHCPTHPNVPKMNEPAFLPSHRHLATLPYSHKNHILPQGFEHAFPPLMPHANKYPTVTTKPTSSPRLHPRQKQLQWASPRLPLAPLSDNFTMGPNRVSDPAPSSPSNSPPLYSFLPQYEHKPGHRQYKQESRHLIPPQRPSSSTSSVAYLQTAAAAVIATAHQTHFQYPSLPSPQDRFFAKPHNFHFGDKGDEGPAESAFSRGRQGEPGEEEEEEEKQAMAMERYRDDVERQSTFAPTHPSLLPPPGPAALSFPRDVSDLRDSPYFRPMAQHNAMYQRPRPQQQKQQRQQYDVSDLGHDLAYSISTPIEDRVGLGGHVGSFFFQEQHNSRKNSPSPPQHVDRHDAFRPWLPLGLQCQRDLAHLNRRVDVEDEFLHPQPVRSIAQHLYECQDQEGPVIGQYYSTWTRPRDRAREQILHSQETLQDDNFWHHSATNYSGHASQGAQPQLASSKQYHDDEVEEEEEEQEMRLDDPASAHQSCIETLSELEQDLAEMQSRYNALQQECDNLRRSNGKTRAIPTHTHAHKCKDRKKQGLSVRTCWTTFSPLVIPVNMCMFFWK